MPISITLGLRAVLSAALAAACVPSCVAANPWEETQPGSGFWFRMSGTLPTSDGGKVPYEALKFDRKRYFYELVLLEDLFDKAYPDRTPEGIVYDDETDTSRVLQPTVSEAWRLLEKDQEIVALIPAWFSAVSGDARIVGLLKKEGKVSQGIFAAPNLDTAFCLDDRDAHDRLSRAGRSYDGQIPFLIPIRYDAPTSYSYLGDLDALDLSTSDGGEQGLRETFEKCDEIIQIGYRLVEPNGRTGDTDAPGRLTNGPASMKKLRPHARVVMLYDGNGHLNIVQVMAPAHLYDVGRHLASWDYYGDITCRYPDRRVRPGKDTRSRSCEIWAVTLSAYENTPLLIRRSFVYPGETDTSPIVWGDWERPTPALLVVRRAAPRPPE